MFVSEKQENWDLLLDELTLAYRTAVNESTGVSPFEMLYGRLPKIPADIVFGKPDNCPSLELEYSDYVVELKARLEEIYEYVQNRHKIKVEKMKLVYDRNVRLSNYEAGDRVWLQRSETRKGLSKKLSMKWKGPYVVVQKIDEKL
jgi:hypothetical protein